MNNGKQHCVRANHACNKDIFRSMHFTVPPLHIVSLHCQVLHGQIIYIRNISSNKNISRSSTHCLYASLNKHNEVETVPVKINS